MIYRYLYPVWIESNTYFKIGSSIHRTIEGFYAFWLDEDHMKSEYITTSMKNDLGNRLCMINALVSIPRFSTDFLSIITDKKEQDISQARPIVDRGSERYFLVQNTYIHVTKDIIEVVQPVKNAIRLSGISDISTSVFEQIAPITIPRGTVYRNEESTMMETTHAMSLLYSNVSQSIQGLHRIYFGTGRKGISTPPCISDLCDNVRSSRKQWKAITHLEPNLDKYRSYSYRKYTIQVKKGYTKITLTYASTLYKNIYKTYKDVLILYK